MIYDGIIFKPSLDDVLAHHGILGQKWGKKNGPPYPLDSKVSTGKRLKDTQDSSNNDKFDKLSTFYKKLGQSSEYVQLSNKVNKLQSELEEYDVGSKSQSKIAKKKINQLSKELRKTLDEKDEEYDKIKEQYKDISKEFPGFNEDPYNSNKYQEDWIKLDKIVIEKSGDWYNGKPVSEGFKKCEKEYNELLDKYYSNKNRISDSVYRNEKQKIQNELVNIVLDDVGYENNAKNKEIIESVLFWD